MKYLGQESSSIRRDIASDCQSAMSLFFIKKEISSPVKKAPLKTSIQLENLQKAKLKTWNKITGPHEFSRFNDNEYFKWIENYKDQIDDALELNPKTIEQKMAVIEIINTKLALFFQNKQYKLTDEIEKLSIRRLKKLEKHLLKLDLSSRVYTENLDDYTRELFIIIKGPPVELEHYFSRDNFQISKRILRMAQEDSLRMGLKGLIARIPEKSAYSKMEKAKIFIHKAMKYKVTQLYFLPYKLPPIKNVQIPDELMEKILLNGLDAHESEVISYFKKQNRIDHYENFRKVYSPFAYALGAYYYYNVITNKVIPFIKEQNDKHKFSEEFKEISSEVLLQMEGCPL